MILRPLPCRHVLQLQEAADGEASRVLRTRRRRRIRHKVRGGRRRDAADADGARLEGRRRGHQ